MPASKAEQVLDALEALLEMVPGAVVERKSVLPEKIPDGGLIMLRDGDPGEPEQTLGGFGTTYYQHAVEVEADPTLGSLAFGLTYSRPKSNIEALPGAPAIKSATLRRARMTRLSSSPVGRDC
jgi:hypothetical protein